jgi:hypothetical protein
MERNVVFRNDQKIIADDLNNIGIFARQSFDTIVADAVSSLRYFTGFSTSKTGQTEITVAAGHYWGGGPVYRRDENVVFNLLTGGNYMPTVTKRIVAVVTYGDTIDSDVQQRSFVIDDQGTTEPQSVAMESLRYAHLALVAGTEGPDPQKPTLDANVIPVAWVTLTTSGVVDGGIEMATAYRLPSIESLSQLIKAIDAWRSQIGQLLNTILSELVRIQASIPRDPSALLAALLSRIEALEARSHNPDPTPVIKKFIDRFLSGDQTNANHANYNALVDRGLHFAGGTSEVTALALNNPIDPKVKVLNGLTLPAWSSEKTRLEIGGANNSLSLSQYTVQTTVRVHKQLSRRCHEYCPRAPFLGEHEHTYSSLSNLLDRIDEDQSKNTIYTTQPRIIEAKAAHDRIFGFHRQDGEPYTITSKYRREEIDWDDDREHHGTRCREPYWEYCTRDATVNGSQLAQTFLNATNGWMTSVEVPFAQVGAAGNINVFICEVEGGKPVVSHVIGRGVIDVANLNTTTHIKCVLESPVYMQGGRSYAVQLVSTGNHHVRVHMDEDDDKYISGAAFYLSDTAEWLPVQNSGDLCLKLNYAQFDNTRVEVLLEPLTRASGISEIKIVAAQWEPQGTNLTFEVQRAGVWYQISEGEYDALTGNPTLVNLRMVFTGTRDLMPGIDMLQTEVTMTKTEVAFEHWSTSLSVGSATSAVQVHVFLRGYNAAVHTIDCTNTTPGDGVLNHTSVTTKSDLEDDTTRHVIFAFTPTAETAFEVKIVGTTQNANNPFTVVRREAYAVS